MNVAMVALVAIGSRRWGTILTIPIRRRFAPSAVLRGRSTTSMRRRSMGGAKQNERVVK